MPVASELSKTSRKRSQERQRELASKPKIVGVTKSQDSLIDRLPTKDAGVVRRVAEVIYELGKDGAEKLVTDMLRALINKI
jgi:hypothetical protein